MRGNPWWRERFNRFGAKITAPREVVLDVLHRTDEHLSASDIYIRAHSANPSIGLTTVYRTLDMLTSMGIVHKFDFGDGKARFELANNPEGKGHHHHLVCLKCRKIIDYADFMDEEIEYLKKTEEGLAEKYNFQIVDHIIRFYGICSDCQVNKSK